MLSVLATLNRYAIYLKVEYQVTLINDFPQCMMGNFLVDILDFTGDTFTLVVSLSRLPLMGPFACSRYTNL